MGTRAIVKLNGKIVAFTHWDGNPNVLGRDLVALFENIKSSDYDYGKKPFKMKKDFVLGVCLMYQVDGTKNSADIQEWEYDIRDDGVYAKFLLKENANFVKLPELYEFLLYDIDSFVISNGKIKKTKKGG